MASKLVHLKALAAFASRAKRLLASEDFLAWAADVEARSVREVETVATQQLNELDTAYLRGIIEGSRRLFRELRASAEDKEGERIAKAIRAEEERIDERRTEREPVGLPGIGLRGDSF